MHDKQNYELSESGKTFFGISQIICLYSFWWWKTVFFVCESGLEYIKKQDPDILKLRIEIMIKESCEEFALNLCNWSLKHPALENDLEIKEFQIFILYKQSEFGKMQEVVSVWCGCASTVWQR